MLGFNTVKVQNLQANFLEVLKQGLHHIAVVTSISMPEPVAMPGCLALTEHSLLGTVSGGPESWEVP